jgi:hypothetical protein
MAKTKEKNNAEKMDDLIMDGMPGADTVSEEEAQPFGVDLNFDEVQEDENEEAEGQNDAIAEEEVAETEPEAESTAEETAEPEAISEEGVDEDSEPVAQPDIQTIEGSEQSPDEQTAVKETKAPMVPKSRLDEVLAKNKAMQKRLNDAEQAETQALENAPEYAFDEKEAQYQDHCEMR